MIMRMLLKAVMLALLAPAAAQATTIDDFVNGAELGMFLIFMLVVVIVAAGIASGSTQSASSPHIVDQYSDGNGSKTWTETYFSDGTGVRVTDHYVAGHLNKTTEKKFAWVEGDRGKVRTWC